MIASVCAIVTTTIADDIALPRCRRDSHEAQVQRREAQRIAVQGSHSVATWCASDTARLRDDRTA